MTSARRSSSKTVTSCPGCRPAGPSTGRSEGVELARQTYVLGEHPVAREVARRTLGSDDGGNSYATLAEVKELAGLIALGPGRRLLDVGAGQGWPGLFLARQTGCTVVLTDVPLEGLVNAARRANGEGLAARALAVVADGRRLPLRGSTFDAVVHADVLCCLRPKLATLRASFGALRAGGRTAFSVIFPTLGLSATANRRAIDAGPPHCGLRTSYPSLLRSAGFVDIEEHDRTPSYLGTAARKLEVGEDLADDLIEMLGREQYDELQAGRRIHLEAIADGLLQRSLFVARRPNRTPAPRPVG